MSRRTITGDPKLYIPARDNGVLIELQTKRSMIERKRKKSCVASTISSRNRVPKLDFFLPSNAVFQTCISRNIPFLVLACEAPW